MTSYNLRVSPFIPATKASPRRHRIQFPRKDVTDLGQDEAFFYLQQGDNKQKIRFHDYAAIYDVPGLYEQVFYDRLQCNSPSKVADILTKAVRQSELNSSELRVLDLGAGNGMMGEELTKQGISRLVGVDIIEQAYNATIRDRPGLYDAYYVEDFAALPVEKLEEIASWQCNCMVSVAALGFGDIPTSAFVNALNCIENGGWVAFNIKESFFDKRDKTGFSKLIRKLIYSEYFDVHHIERYRHRLSIEGEPLYYFAIVGRKHSDVPLNKWFE